MHLTRNTIIAMYKNNFKEFISKIMKIISEDKAKMIVDDITYNNTDGTYDSSVFTEMKNTDFSKTYLVNKIVQEYIFVTI